MRFLYIDEAGDDTTYTPSTPDQPPVFALVGISIPSSQHTRLIWNFLRAKKRYFPELKSRRLTDLIQYEHKGATIRKQLRSTSRRKKRNAIGFIDMTLSLLERTRSRIFGEIWIKKSGHPLIPEHLYQQGVAHLARSFENQLAANSTSGLMILDSRTKSKNAGNVHQITTRRYRTGGSLFPHLMEAPVFGHSDTHVALQLADVITSALVFPLACWTYCQEYTENVNVSPEYADLQIRFGERLKALQIYQANKENGHQSGLHVSDRIHHLPADLIFTGKQ